MRDERKANITPEQEIGRALELMLLQLKDWRPHLAHLTRGKEYKVNALERKITEAWSQLQNQSLPLEELRQKTQQLINQFNEMGNEFFVQTQQQKPHPEAEKKPYLTKPEIDREAAKLWQTANELLAAAKKSHDPNLKQIQTLKTAIEEFSKKTVIKDPTSLKAASEELAKFRSELAEVKIKPAWKSAAPQQDQPRVPRSNLFAKHHVDRDNIHNEVQRHRQSAYYSISSPEKFQHNEFRLKIVVLHKIISEHKDYWKNEARFGELPQPLGKIAKELESIMQDGKLKNGVNAEEAWESIAKLAKGAFLDKPKVSELKEAIQNGHSGKLSQLLKKVEETDIPRQAPKP